MNVPAWMQSLPVDRLDEYFGLWAFRPETFLRIVDAHRKMDLRAHVAERLKAMEDDEPARDSPTRAARAARRPDGVAIIQLRGALMKFVGSMSAGTSTVFARQMVRAMARDDQTRGVVIVIDSPGGTVSGTFDLVAEIEALAARKPVVAFIEDLAASAGYAVATPADRIIATPTSFVGSIGTYAVIVDSSKAAEMEGLKVHVISTGEMKGAGVDGTEITDAMLADVRRNVSDANAHFLAAVAKGRTMTAEQVQQVADGRVWIAQEALARRLIDAIGNFDQAIATVLTLVEQKGGKRRHGGSNMSHEDNEGGVMAPPTPKAATLKELKSAFPRADAAFREACMDKELTLAQAKDAWLEKIEADLAVKTEELNKLKAEAEAAARRPSGAPPIVGGREGPAGAEEAGSAGERFTGKVEQLMARDKRLTRAQATARIAAEYPELQQAWIEETNAARVARR